MSIARQYDARIINIPLFIAKTDSLTLLKYIIDYESKYNGVRVGTIVLLQPTSPLRSTDDIDGCLDTYFSGYDSLTTVTGERENGAVYITHAEIIQRDTIYGSTLYRYPIPEERAVDIDTLEDFKKAEDTIGGENDYLRGLHQLERLGRGKRDNNKGKRGRRRAS